MRSRLALDNYLVCQATVVEAEDGSVDYRQLDAEHRGVVEPLFSCLDEYPGFFIGTQNRAVLGSKIALFESQV